MTPENENQEASPKESFSQRIIVLSFVTLYLGVIFVFGQSSLLGFHYLSTFEYSDFLLSSALLIPFFIAILFGATLFAMLALEPFHQFTKARRAFTTDNWSRNKQAIRSIFDFVRITSVPLFIVISMLCFMDYFIVAVVIYLCLLLTTHAIEKLWTRNLAIKPETETDTKDSVSDFLDKTIDYLVGTQPGWVLMTFLVFGFGQANIEFQDKEKIDATLYFSEGIPSIDGNVLASNSNVLAIFVDGKIQLIPRNKITKIEYGYSSPYRQK